MMNKLLFSPASQTVHNTLIPYLECNNTTCRNMIMVYGSQPSFHKR
jgi:hypothetical protein